MFIKYSASYFWYFAVVGLSIPFLSVYLEGKGFDSLAIGQILAVFTATKIFGPTLWATFTDKTGKQLAVIRTGALLALLTFCGLFFVDGFWPIIFFLTLFGLFWTAILPQMEVMTLRQIRRSPKIYARIRLWGSVGFVVLAVVAGEVIDLFGVVGFIWLGVITLLGLWSSTLLLKEHRVVRKKDQIAPSIFTRIFTLPFLLFFIAGLLLQVSFGPFYTFFALYLRDLAYPSYAVGLFMGVGILAEIAVFLFAGKLFSYFSIKSLFAFSLLITAFRWYLMGRYGDLGWVLVLAQLIHAASFGLYHSASMQFIQQHFKANQQNRGQALYIGGVYGLGGAIGAYLAGVLWQDGSGAELSFYLAGFAAFIASIFALCIPKRHINKVISN